MRVIEIKEVKLEKIRVPEWAIRTVMDEAELRELANSIEAHGQIEPIVVRLTSDGHYELISGYRRLQALKTLNAKEVEAKVAECTDEEAIAMSIEENEKRASEHPLDTAKKVAYLRNAKGLTSPEIAKLLGKSESWVRKLWSINAMPREVKEILKEKADDVEKLYLISTIDDPIKQAMVARLVADFDLSRKEVEDIAKEAKSMDLKEFGTFCDELRLKLREGVEESLIRHEGVRMRTSEWEDRKQGGGAEGAGDSSTLTSLQVQGTPPTSQEGITAPGTGSPPQVPGQPPAQGPQTGQEQRKAPETYTCTVCLEKRERYNIKFYGVCADRHDDLRGMLWDVRRLPPDDIDSIFTALRQVEDFLLTYPKELRSEIAQSITELLPHVKGLGAEVVKQVVEEVKRRIAPS